MAKYIKKGGMTLLSSYRCNKNGDGILNPKGEDVLHLI